MSKSNRDHIRKSIEKIFPGHDNKKVSGLIDSFIDCLQMAKSDRVNKVQQPKGKQKDQIKNKIKTLKSFRTFLEKELFPFQKEEALSTLTKRDVKQQASLVKTIDDYLMRLEYEMDVLNLRTIKHRPVNKPRAFLCGEMIMLLYVHLRIEPTLSRDETPFNKFIAFGVEQLEDKPFQIDQVYRQVKDEVVFLKENDMLNLFLFIHENRDKGLIIEWAS